MELTKQQNKTKVQEYIINSFADKTKIIEAAFPYDVYLIVMRYYNTNKKVAIKFNRKFIHNGVISLTTQTAGTFTQMQNYLNMQAQEFTNKILTK